MNKIDRRASALAEMVSDMVWGGEHGWEHASDEDFSQLIKTARKRLSPPAKGDHNTVPASTGADSGDREAAHPPTPQDSGLADELEALITKGSRSPRDSMSKAIELANFVTQHDIEILTALRQPRNDGELLRDARVHLNHTALLTGNLEWKADLRNLVNRIDATLARLDQGEG